MKIYKYIYRLYGHFAVLLRQFFLKKEKKRYFLFDLAVVCIIKNEGKYIKEWIDYYILQGVNRFYIYDNESCDDTKSILQPYIDDGLLIYHYFPGRARQLDAYNIAIKNYKYDCKYMMVVDADEFVVQENSAVSLYDTIVDIMKKNKRAGGIAVNWRVYGSSGYLTRPDGFVICNYLYRGNGEANGNDCIKSIINPRAVNCFKHPHYPMYKFGFYNINEDGFRVDGWSNKCQETKYIRVNHYFTKSKEEWIERRNYGKVTSIDINDKRTIEEFYEHDNNDIYDDIMMKYARIMQEGDC